MLLLIERRLPSLRLFVLHLLVLRLLILSLLILCLLVLRLLVFLCLIVHLSLMTKRILSFAGAKAKAYSSAPPWAAGGGGGDSGAWARAALLSGPPGIGKTTTAMAVCRELRLATIEMNASDTRSKRSLQEEVSEALGMRSLANMLTAKGEALVFPLF